MSADEEERLILTSLVASDDTDEDEDLTADCSEYDGRLQLPLWYKVSRTCVLFLLYFIMGANTEIAIQTNSTYDAETRVLAFQSFGRAIGSLIGGLVIDKSIDFVDIGVSAMLVGYTMVSVAVAYVSSMALLCITLSLQGVLAAAMSIGCYRIIVKLWQDNAASHILALHIGSGIGSLLVPLLFASYMNPELSQGARSSQFESDCHNYSSILLSANGSMNCSQPLYPADIALVRWFLSSLTLPTCVMLVAFHIYGKCKDLAIASINDPVRTSKGPCTNALVLVTLALFCGISLPMIRVLSRTINSYAEDGPYFGVNAAATLEMTYFIAVTVGRAAAFVAVSFVHTTYILQVEILMTVLCSVILFVFQTHIGLLWIFLMALGFFSGSLYPSSLAWANSYLTLTSANLILPQLGAAFGDMTLLFVTGHSYDLYGPSVVWQYVLGMALALVALSWLLQCLVSCRIPIKRNISTS